MSAFIGGNLDAIAASADRIDKSAAMAITTGESTASAADLLQTAVNDAMADLIKKFDVIAGDLNEDITTAHGQLVDADWKGASRDNAVAIKQQLQTQVTTVLGNATTNLGLERDAFNQRASAIVDSVNKEFKTVMTQIDTEFSSLAKASRQTRENLLAADGTIKMG